MIYFQLRAAMVQIEEPKHAHADLWKYEIHVLKNEAEYKIVTNSL